MELLPADMSQRLCPAHDRIRVRQGLSDAVLYDGISETRTKASFYGIIFRDASGHADWTDGIQKQGMSVRSNGGRL